MESEWVNKAALYEITSLAFLYTSQEVVNTLVSGEYANAFQEIVATNSLNSRLDESVFEEFGTYYRSDEDKVLHSLRVEYTRLFIGAPRALVSPFAGLWYAADKGLDPVMFVNKESMAVERFMSQCGMARPDKTNEPLDHIGTELEFLNYLSLSKAQVIAVDEDISISETAYADFYTKHFSEWSKRFASEVLNVSTEPFFRAAATILKAFPDSPL